MFPDFDDIIGNSQIKTYLKRMIEKETIGNSLLFSGPDGIGKGLFAHAFAKIILASDHVTRRRIEGGNHPDIHVYRPEGKTGMHSIDTMRRFNAEVYMQPYEGKHKIFIIHDADRMLPYSANALLKTFEEPSLDSIIILVSSAPEHLLPTILSRCRTVHFQPVPKQEIAELVQSKSGKDPQQAAHIAALAQGSISHALRIAEQGEDPIRKLVLAVLSKGKVATYARLTGIARQIAEQIESHQKEVSDDIRGEMVHIFGGELTAVQKQQIEKEVEGIASLKKKNEAHEVFEVILGCYRDMHLLHIGGNPEYLFHPDYKEAIDQKLQSGGLLPMETVQEAIADAGLALQRSTSLQVCLENLLLRLNLL